MRSRFENQAMERARTRVGFERRLEARRIESDATAIAIQRGDIGRTGLWLTHRDFHSLNVGTERLAIKTRMGRSRALLSGHGKSFVISRQATLSSRRNDSYQSHRRDRRHRRADGARQA